MNKFTLKSRVKSTHPHSFGVGKIERVMKVEAEKDLTEPYYEYKVLWDETDNGEAAPKPWHWEIVKEKDLKYINSLNHCCGNF